MIVVSIVFAKAQKGELGLAFGFNFASPSPPALPHSLLSPLHTSSGCNPNSNCVYVFEDVLVGNCSLKPGPERKLPDNAIHADEHWVSVLPGGLPWALGY